MNAIYNWYVRNQDPISWFVIGLITYAFITRLGEGSYGWAALDAALIYINYKLISVRLQ